MRLAAGGRIGRGEIWAIAGGKGGTGKSFLTASLGIQLASQGRRVVLVDADLGCANLHTWLGIPYPEATLSDLIKARIRKIDDILIDTGIENLRIISGAQDILEIANPKYSQKMRIIRQIQELDVDYILLDLGAGTSFNILDFFLVADQGVLAINPEPTSIENVYRFIKSAFYRRFKKIVKEQGIRDLIATAMDQKNELGIKTPHDLLAQVRSMDEGVGSQLQAQMYGFRPKLVVNQIRSRDDIALGFSMRSSCSRYFGITIEYVGAIEFDDAVRQAARRRRPVMLDYPNSNAARGIGTVAEHLISRSQMNLNNFLGNLPAEKPVAFRESYLQ
jgi:flagellar biosynthesis protein FlhG